MSYSGNGGGTLTLPSPTHVHHVDVSSAVRSLRRSLSRSPSKFRLVTPRSPSSSPQSPLSPTHAHAPPLSRALSQPNVSSSFPSGAQAYTPSPLAKQFPTSVKLSLRSASRAKAIPSRGTSRTRTSPKSPLKRALSASSDSGNSQITTTSEELEGLENRRGGSLSPTTRKSLDRQKAMPEVAAPINLALSRVSEVDIDASATISSPLKRNDAIMNLDQASLGSPVAKRRSLHGSGGFGHDFNVFDHGPSSSPRFDIHEDSHKEYQLSAAGIIGAALEAEHLPRRSSSLRKSTLQQRQEQKRSWGRRSALNALNSMSSANSSQEPSPSPEEASTPVAPRTSRPRLSLDQFVPPTAARESPFVQGALPNASVHMLHQNQHTTHQPHPLSRTMTTSSSTSSLADDSPTHLPVHFAEHPRPKLDFSKSLPAGSLRPFALEAAAREHASNSFATPESYRAVKPLPAAFMSTGLISKVNRNPEEVSAIRVKGMPDTPCKKPVAGFSVVAGPVPGSAIAKARHIRHSFGAPSTPFNPHGATFMQGTFGKGATFGHAFGNRRSSFLSNDGEDCIESPENQSDSQSSADYDMPPTPTKQSLTSDSCGIRSPYGLRSMPLPVSAIGQGRPQVHPRKSSKLNIFINRDDQEEDEDEEDDTDLSEPDLSSSPTTAHFRGAMGSSVTFPSFARNRARRGSNLASPAPLLTRSLKASFSGHGQSPPFSPSRRPGFAKISHVAPASPLERIDFFERPARSPRTPATEDSVVPPDPSGLSIRAERDDGQEGKMQGVQSSGAGVSMLPPPATPTTGRESFLSFGLGHSKSITPITDFSAAQVDEALTSRFEKIELVGTGEFSQVYRVTQPAPSIALGHRHHQFHFGGPGSPMTASRSSLPDRVFAVKKSRQPYQGHRDRARKLQEVNVLRALGHSDHVVHLLDSWESKDHLYIQTEFCEEGSLDLFLTQVGRKGRLDDFRIWKILLELGQVSRVLRRWNDDVLTKK